MSVSYTKSLKFFNKNGDPINLSYDADTWKWSGNMHLPEVAVKLFENETIYIVEEFENANDGFSIFYQTPHIQGSLKAKWKINSSPAYKVFTVDNPYHTNPLIAFPATPFPMAGIDRATASNFINSGDNWATFDDDPYASRIDIGLASDDDGVYEATLLIYDDAMIIAEINFYGEIIGEDERLNIALSNLGESIAENLEYVFAESDINEDLPNYKILNQKRKELLLELHNIAPYLAGIKGIINIIKYFGFYNIKLKEYWKDVTTGHKALREVVIGNNDNLDKDIDIVKYPYQRSSYFGLFYDINRVVPDQFDEDGLPTTEDANLFSNEEIIIKLFGLKNYIDERKIGGVAQIIDIIGEIVQFKRYALRSWVDNSAVYNMDLQILPKFSISKSFGYIEDIRPIIEDFASCPLPPEAFNTTNTIQFGNYPNCFVGYFDPLFMTSPNYLDEPNIPIGLPITLTNHSFDLLWKDCMVSWLSTLNANMTVTWNTISKLNYYEIEWVVTKHVTAEDKRTWEFRQRGKPDDLSEVTIILPYDGFYDVTLIIYGYNNEISKKTYKNIVEARLREADFISFFRYFDKKLQHWNTNSLRWKDLHNEWKNPVFDNNNFLIDENEVQIGSYNIVNYINTDLLGFPNVGVDPPTWNQFPNATWKDYGFLNWRSLVHEREKLAEFKITKIKAGGTIQIGEDVITLPLTININDFTIVSAILIAETGIDVSSFDYLTRPVAATPKFIDATSKSEGYLADRFIGCAGGVEILADYKFTTWNEVKFKWVDMPITWANAASIFRTKAVENPFTYDNVQIYNDRYMVPVMIPIFLLVDNSKMPGKTKVEWKITNEDTGEVVFDETIFTLVYRFDSPAYYSIEAVITDTNGNVNSKKKFRHIKVVDCDTYSNYQRYKYANDPELRIAAG